MFDINPADIFMLDVLGENDLLERTIRLKNFY